MRIYYLGIYSPQEPNNGFRNIFKSITADYIEDDVVTLTKRYGRSIDKYILSRVVKFKPDVFFCQIQRDGIITPNLLNSIPCLKINWTGDVRAPLPDWYIRMGKYFNLTLFTNTTDVDTIRKHGITADYFQVSADTNIYRPDGIKDKSHEIVFMGNNYADTFPLSKLRREMVHTLQKKYGDRFHAYGDGWGGKHTNYNQLKEAEIYRGCKIAINLSHFDYGRYSSDRIFRIMMCGAFCLTHSYKDLRIDFPIKTNDTFSHYEEMIDSIEYYLYNQQERIEIANNGYHHVMQHHTPQVRGQELLNLINKYEK